MKKKKEDELRHKARKKRIRFKIGLGTAERPRITVFKSNRNFYAQAIDDEKGFTIASISTLEKNLQLGKDSESSKKLGNILSLRLKEKGVNRLVFDRNGYKYHGVIMNFAASLREAGISF